MRPQYEAWILNYLADLKVQGQPVRAQCQNATELMQKTFPELIRVPGQAIWSSDGDEGTEHWWCVDPETNEVIDPTVSQFLRTPGRYKAWAPGDEVRVGACMNCGADIYLHCYVLGKIPPKEELPPGVSGSSCSLECYNQLCEEYA